MLKRKSLKIKNVFEDYTVLKDYINRINTNLIPHKTIKGVTFDGVAAVFTIAKWFTLLSTVFIYLKMGYSILYLKPAVISSNLLYAAISSVIPFGIWALSTTSDYMSFHQQKRFYFYLCCVHALTVCVQVFYEPLCRYVIFFIKHIKISPIFTGTMAMNFAAWILLVLHMGIAGLLYWSVRDNLFKESFVDVISTFRLHHYVDFSPNRQYRYHLSYANEIETGKKVVIKERDRFTATLVDGGSGTGKTTMIAMNTANDDLNRKLTNLKLIEEEAFEYAKKGMLKLKDGKIENIYKNGLFDIHAFTDRNDDKIVSKLANKYPNCGITIVAPDNSFVDDGIKLIKSKGIKKYFVLDPTYDEVTGKLKENLIGINPFRIVSNWESLSLERLEDEVSSIANLIADVLIAVNNMEGAQSNAYFESINRAVTVNISTVLVIGVPALHNRYATFDDFSVCVNDFSLLKPYIDKLEEKYGPVGDISIPQSPNPKKGRRNIDEYEGGYEHRVVFSVSGQQANETKVESNNVEDTLSSSKNPFKVAISQIKSELIGQGASTMFEQARGLRNMTNIFMSNTKLRRIYTMKESLDFDEMMEKGYCVLVNTALTDGQVSSKSFGLFFLLLYKRAMFRRPVASRKTCFQSFLVDELPKYNTLEWEDMITLARKFGIMFTAIIQSLGQFSKNDTTKYLEDVFLGAGTHVVFGRAGVKDMEYYSKLDGNVYKDLERHSESGNSLLEDRSSESFGIMKERKAVAHREGSQIRHVDFKELTIYSCNEGHTVPSKLAKSYFLEDINAYKEAEKADCDWESIKSLIIDTKDNESMEGKKTAANDLIEDYIDNLESEILFTGKEIITDNFVDKAAGNTEGTKDNGVRKEPTKEQSENSNMKKLLELI